MTIANCFVHPSGRWAILGTDSLAVDSEGKRYELSKLYVLPHLHVAFVCRGLVRVAQALFNALNHPGLDFDTAVEHMAALAEECQKQVYAADGPLPTSMSDQHVPSIVMVAWRDGGIRARVWNGFTDPALAVYDVSPGGRYLGPHAEEIMSMRCATSADMEKVAQRQCEIFRAQAAAKGEHPPALGSWFYVAHVSEDRIAIERRCKLDEPARPQSLFSAGPAVASA